MREDHTTSTNLRKRTMKVEVPGSSHQLRRHIRKQAVITVILSLLNKDGSNGKNGANV